MGFEKEKMKMSPSQKLKLVDKLLDSVDAKMKKPPIVIPEFHDYIRSNSSKYYYQRLARDYRAALKNNRSMEVFKEYPTSMAAFTTANARHRHNHNPHTNHQHNHHQKSHKDLLHSSADSLNSVDSGNFSTSLTSSPLSPSSSPNNNNNINIYNTQQRSRNIKRVIISEKISPYQLKIEQSKCIKLPTITINANNNNATSLNHRGSNNNNNNNHSHTLPIINTTSYHNNHSCYNTYRQSETDVDILLSNNNACSNNNANSNGSNEELNEDDVEFLVANTGFSLEQIKNWHAEFIEKCTNGLIAYEQFKIYYKLLLPGHLTENQKEELILKLFRLFDIDTDGYLNYSEFLVSFWIRCRAPIREKFTWIFNMLDLDRNGSLNYTELRAALSLCLNTVDLDDLMRQINRDVSIHHHHHTKSTTNQDEDYDDDNNDDDDDDDEDDDDAQKKKKKKTQMMKERFLKTFFYDTEEDSGSNSSSSDGFGSDLSLNRSNRTSSTSSSSSSFGSSMMSPLRDESGNRVGKDDDIHRVIMMLLNAVMVIGGDCDRETKVKEEKLSKSHKIQMNREEFLFLCERYEPLRKLIIPIRYFYDDDLNLNESGSGNC